MSNGVGTSFCPHLGLPEVSLRLGVKGKNEAFIPNPGRGSVPKILGLRLGARAMQDSHFLIQGPGEPADLHRNQDPAVGRRW